MNRINSKRQILRFSWIVNNSIIQNLPLRELCRIFTYAVNQRSDPIMKNVSINKNRFCSQSEAPILTALVSLSSSLISYSMNPFSCSFSQSVAGPLLIFSDSSSDMTDNSINHDYAASVQSDSRFITLREHNYFQMLTVVLIIPSSHRMQFTPVCRIQLFSKHNT